jgi:ABC-type transport system involved in multi-copper enzyme maturation permease subunit
VKKISLVIFILFLIFIIGWLYINLNSKNALNNFYPTISNKKIATEEKNEITPTLSNETNSLSLEIVSPQNNTTVSASIVTITGKTKPNVEVFIDDKELIADSQGNFSLNYQLDEGVNEIVIVANDELGNYIEKELSINLETNQ